MISGICINCEEPLKGCESIMGIEINSRIIDLDAINYFYLSAPSIVGITDFYLSWDDFFAG